jgi:hypothetical protein
MARRRSEPLFGSPCHRCPAFASFPPVRPRACERARFRASPGIRVSRFRRRCLRSFGGLVRLSPAAFRTSSASENKKPSGALAREGSRGTRMSIARVRRDRSHEPGMRCRLAGSHSAVDRAFHMRVACFDSCSPANTMFARRGDVVGPNANVNGDTPSL